MPKKKPEKLRQYHGPIEKGPDGKYYVAKPKPKKKPKKKTPEQKKAPGAKFVPLTFSEGGVRRGRDRGVHLSDMLVDKRVMRRHYKDVLADRVYNAVFFNGKKLTDHPWEGDFKDYVRRHLGNYRNYRKMLVRALVAREVLMRGASSKTEAAERFGDQIKTQRARLAEISSALSDLEEVGLVTTIDDVFHVSREFHADRASLNSQVQAANERKGRFKSKPGKPAGDIRARRRAELKRRGLLQHVRKVSPKKALHRARMFDLYGRKVEPDKLGWSDRRLVAYLEGMELPPKQGLHARPRHRTHFGPGMEFHDEGPEF